jgi:hypothetical protein
VKILKPGICVDIRGASESEVNEVIDKCVSLGARKGVNCDKVFVKWGYENHVWLSGNCDGYTVITVSEALGRTDNDWHERVELPPIGAPVEIFCDDLFYGQGESGKVVAHVEDVAVIRMSYGLGCFAAKNLRPLKTECEKFVERFNREWNAQDKTIYEFAADQYDKGLRYVD